MSPADIHISAVINLLEDYQKDPKTYAREYVYALNSLRLAKEWIVTADKKSVRPQ